MMNLCYWLLIDLKVEITPLTTVVLFSENGCAAFLEVFVLLPLNVPESGNTSFRDLYIALLIMSSYCVDAVFCFHSPPNSMG
jgi:hypothetical protein